MNVRVVATAFIFIAVFAYAAPASAALKVKWDCYLPNASVDCDVLRNSLMSKIPFLVSSPNDPDVTVTVSSVPAENATRFKFDFVGRSVDGYVAQVHTTDKIPSSIDATTTLVRVMTKIERGLGDFMDQNEAAEVKNGRLSIVLTDPVDAPFAGRPEQTSRKWYVSPSVGSYFSDVVGVGINASGNASVTYNYSGATWRLQQSIGASFTQLSQPVPGVANETATVDFIGANAQNVISRDVTRSHQLSVALLASSEKNPQANYTFRANASLGFEFDLVPRQTESQKNLGFRCAVGPEMQRYDTTNVAGVDQQVVPREFCDVFFSWHFRPIDLSASVGENVVLTNTDYTSFSAGLSATWRITDNWVVSPWVSLQEIIKAINEAQPITVASNDPEQEIEASMRAAVEQGYTAPFGIQSGLSLKYVFGNGSLASEDQRWRSVSNLR